MFFIESDCLLESGIRIGIAKADMVDYINSQLRPFHLWTPQFQLAITDNDAKCNCLIFATDQKIVHTLDGAVTDVFVPLNVWTMSGALTKNDEQKIYDNVINYVRHYSTYKHGKINSYGYHI